MRLLKVELVRLLARRAVLVLLAVAVVVPTVIGVIRVIDTRPPAPEAMAAAEQQAEEESERRYVQRSLRRCLERPSEWGIAEEGDVRAKCEEYVLPQPDWFLYYEPLTLVGEREGSGIAVVVILSIVALLIGTTFAGHDWASGSMSNQLLFEPRRWRVWTAKALAVALVVLVTATLVTSVFWSAVAAVVSSRDDDAGWPVLLDSLQLGWRGAAVATAMGLVGYGLAMLFRSTVASLGIVAGVAVAGGIVLATAGLAPPWDPSLNVLAIVQNGAVYLEEVACGDGSEGCSVERTLPLTHGLVYLGSVSLVALAASLTSFLRRDVP